MASGLTACGGHGSWLFPHDDTPSGQIRAVLSGTTTPVSTSSAQPTIVHNGFSVMVSEKNYAGAFTGSIVSYTAPTTQSCYTIQFDASGTIASFTPRTAPAISGATPSPCANFAPPLDTEGALFEDDSGNKLKVFVQNAG